MNRFYTDISPWIDENRGVPYADAPEELQEAYEYSIYTLFEADVKDADGWALNVMYHAYKEIPYRTTNEEAFLMNEEDLIDWICKLSNLGFYMRDENPAESFIEIAKRIQKTIIRNIYEMVQMDLAANGDVYAEFIKEYEETTDEEK